MASRQPRNLGVQENVVDRRAKVNELLSVYIHYAQRLSEAEIAWRTSARWLAANGYSSAVRFPPLAKHAVDTEIAVQ